MLLQRTYCVPLTEYCTGGCYYCVQNPKFKSRKDTDEELQNSLERLHKLIKSIKENFNLLSQFYYLEMHLMGGELLEAPDWFQKELADLLIKECIWDYARVKIFSNGKNISTAPLVLHTVNHPYLRDIEWIFHVLNYRKYSYTQLLDYYKDIPHKIFIIIVSSRDYTYLKDWIMKEKELKIPIFFSPLKDYTSENWCISAKDTQRLCIKLQELTHWSSNVQLVPEEKLNIKMKNICFTLAKHGSTPLASCHTRAHPICCGALTYPSDKVNRSYKDTDYYCNALRGINNPEFTRDCCDQCSVPEGYLLNLLVDSKFNYLDFIHTLRRIEYEIPPHSFFPSY